MRRATSSSERKPSADAGIAERTCPATPRVLDERGELPVALRARELRRDRIGGDERQIEDRSVEEQAMGRLTEAHRPGAGLRAAGEDRPGVVGLGERALGDPPRAGGP